MSPLSAEEQRMRLKAQRSYEVRKKADNFNEVGRVKNTKGVASMAIDYRDKEVAEAKHDALPVTVPEEEAALLDDDMIKVLNIILSDFFGEEYKKEGDIFKAWRAACGRAGMLDGQNKERKFFRVLADPKFHEIKRKCGFGIVSIYLLPVLEKVGQEAVEGDKKAQEWVLQMAGMLRDKYDYYESRYKLTHDERTYEINVQGINDTKELRGLIDAIRDEPGAEEGRRRTG